MKTLKLFASIIVCQLAGIVGAFFTTPAINGWYVSVIKPTWNPPAWIFGPVWITLYTLMGIALYLVWQRKEDGIKIEKPIWIFGGQLILNSLWSIFFFGLHNILLALINIIILLAMIAWTIIEFKKISKIAYYLLIPYILWVAFATILNLNIWLLN